MPRRGNIPKRRVNPDPKYKSVVLAKCINTMMESGKKGVAERIAYGAFEIIEEKTKQEPLKVFLKAVENIKPLLEVKSRRVGGATYQVPIEVRSSRSQTLALRWMLKAAKDRNELTMAEKLGNEIVDAYNARGSSIKKREDVHKMAEANRAFAHYRW